MPEWSLLFVSIAYVESMLERVSITVCGLLGGSCKHRSWLVGDDGT
jgi:hypothetical protein